MTRFLVLALLVPACATSSTDDLDETSDDVSTIHHYLLRPGTFSLAGGGKLRCLDGVRRETCPLEPWELVTTPGVSTPAGEAFDELEDHAMIARGNVVSDGNGAKVLRVSALTRAISNVVPAPPCFRVRDLCTIDACWNFSFERLDHAERHESGHIYLDEADPTPDFWGQATPAVQAKIDAGLALSKTRPVYTCGGFEDRDGEDWYWGQQLFVPR